MRQEAAAAHAARSRAGFFGATQKGSGVMNTTGIVRTVDNLGRIVLPKEMRDVLFH